MTATIARKRVESVFVALLECQPEKQAAKLVELCGNDNELRAEVESLLAAATNAKGFLSVAPVRSWPGDGLDSPALLGQRIGPYQLVGELGYGGMATVFLAERADGQYRQQVAIKLVRHGLGIVSLSARFQTERQILAKLQHPNIARLLDGGTATGGWPYLVMEYIQGEPIDTYCRTHQLQLAATLKLFCTVCAAVQYAHQNLIVHRDLKPGNILVTKDGVPKLLDFGIAKLLTPRPAGIEVPITMAGSAPMTPEFAAPEQISGGPITTATDIYSLGVLLYELLSRQRPYELNGSDLATIVRTICEIEPPPPSSVTVPPLRTQLCGDLDNIVLRALRKEPQHRYPSVQRLAEDLERYLAGRPVSASKATLRYRAAKFLKRHTLGVSLAGLMLVVLLAAIATTTWQWRTAQTEYRRAEQHFAQVHELTNTIVFELPNVIEKLPGSTALRKRLLDQGLVYLDRLARERRNDPALRRELATAYYKLAAVQGDSTPPNPGDPAVALADRCINVGEPWFTDEQAPLLSRPQIDDGWVWLRFIQGSANQSPVPGSPSR